MKSTICIITTLRNEKGELLLDCGCVLDGQPCNTLAAERRSRKVMHTIRVAASFYYQFITELVAAGWFMSGGAKMNFDDQVKRIEELLAEYPTLDKDVRI